MPTMMAFALGAAALAQVPDAMDAVVMLQQGSTTCAGALIESGAVVATAYHCVAQGGRPRVTRRDGTRTVGRVRAVDVALDLALVDVPELAGSPSLELGDAPAQGERVWALGHPLGGDLPSGFLDGTLRWAASDGIVAAVGPRALQITAPVNPGNSGGPVVDEKARLVAVVSRRLSGDGLGFAGRAEHVRTLLDRERGPSVLGGTLAVGLVVTSHDHIDGGIAVGGRVEAAVRDRVVVDGTASLPLSARWNAARFGAHEFGRAEGRVGLRQRLGHGPWATTLDVAGGLAWLERLEADDADPFALTTIGEAVPSVSASVRVRSVGLEFGWYLPDRAARATVVLRVPGVLTTF